MPYEALLLGKIQSQIDALDPALRSTVFDHIMRLCDEPTRLSRSSYYPYPPEFQLYEFVDPTGDHRFVILFRYHVDEVRLVLFALGHSQ